MIILKVDLILQDFNTQNRNQEIHFPHNSRPSGSSVTHVRPKNRKTTKKKKDSTNSQTSGTQNLSAAWVVLVLVLDRF